MRLGELKRYEKYKDSGVEWIGEVPEGWEVIRLKFLKNSPFLYGANEASDTDEPNFPRYIRITDIDAKGNLREDTFKSLPFEIAKPYLLKEGDILFARSGATVGKTFIYKKEWGKACFAGYLIKFEAKLSNTNPKFIYYFTQSRGYEDWIKENTIQATIQNVSAEKYGSLYIPFPKIKVQNRVVNFLDQKTSEIDSLIADKEKLIELLQEQRQAIISEAVTKGLDKNVKMKDSGIEWIGEVPEHWEVKRIKHIAFLKSGEGITSELINDEGKYPVYGGNGLRGYTASFTHNGDYILIGRQGALCGNINYAHGKFWASEHAVVVLPVVTIETLWLGELLRIMNLNQYSISAAQPGLAVDKIKNLFLPFPPYQEQKVIADYIGQKISDIDFLIQQIKTQIISIFEYRKSLISEVVTGKIML